MDVLAYTTGFNALVWMNTDVLRLIKYTLRSQKTQLSFQTSPISITADTTEITVRQLDRVTDGFSALYV